MEFHALHQIVLGAFDNLQTATLQRIAESHGRGVTAYDSNSLNALRLISVNRLFCDGVDPRHQRNIYRAVCFGHDGLIYAVARNIEFDARYNTVLRSLFNKTRSVGFSIKLEIEIYRVGSSRNHCLLAYAAPDKHLVAIQIDGFLCGYRNWRGNHIVACKGVLISASGHLNAACRKA